MTEINLENIKKAAELIRIEFNKNMKDKLGSYEFSQLCLAGSHLKSLIEVLSDPNEIIKANKIYKKIYD